MDHSYAHHHKHMGGRRIYLGAGLEVLENGQLHAVANRIADWGSLLFFFRGMLARGSLSVQCIMDPSRTCGFCASRGKFQDECYVAK